MNQNGHKLTAFSEADLQSFAAPLKIGLLATVNPQGLPHLTLISSLQGSAAHTVTWGQFTEGLSKQYVRQNPRTGFLIMTLDKRLWRGKATWTRTANGGPEFEMYNNQPMFRYNAYFGIHTVYYMDLVEHSGRQALPMGAIVLASLLSMVASPLARRQPAETALNLWTRRLLNKLGNLKFLAYIGADGYPLIVPVIQAQAADAQHIVFSTRAYGAELQAIPNQAPLALFGMSLDMEDVLVRGVYQGVRRFAGLPCGVLRVDWVYNAMPPKPGQIYPETPLEAVTEFEE
jgi:hypothetical protein